MQRYPGAIVADKQATAAIVRLSHRCRERKTTNTTLRVPQERPLPVPRGTAEVYWQFLKSLMAIKPGAAQRKERLN